MSTQPNKIQMTVRLEPAVHEAAVAVSNRTGRALAIVVNDAAKQTLLPKDNEKLDSGMQEFAKRTATQINRSRDRTLDELHVVKEMMGLLIRTYLNHTAPVPESERESASRSGRGRFLRILQLLDGNLRSGTSVFDELHVIEDGVGSSKLAETQRNDQEKPAIKEGSTHQRIDDNNPVTNPATRSAVNDANGNGANGDAETSTNIDQP